jgi:hypothetical protein
VTRIPLASRIPSRLWRLAPARQSFVNRNLERDLATLLHADSEVRVVAAIAGG